jgi:hypothetical protein
VLLNDTLQAVCTDQRRKFRRPETMHELVERHDRPVVVFVFAQRRVLAHDRPVFAWATQPQFDRASVRADVREVRAGMAHTREEAQGIDGLEHDGADLAAARAGGSTISSANIRPSDDSRTA